MDCCRRPTIATGKIMSAMNVIPSIPGGAIGTHACKLVHCAFRRITLHSLEWLGAGGGEGLTTTQACISQWGCQR